MSRTRRGTKGPIAALALVVGIFGCATSASASFSTGLVGKYSSTDDATRTQELDWTVEAKAKVARIDVPWRSIATGQPANAADPADPAYDFAGLDAGVRDATSRGLKVVFTVYKAPEFALGPDAPNTLFDGTWRPDPGQFAAFGQALAARYSGSYAGLPRVRFFEVWNEANLNAFMTPQYDGKKLVSADHYRRMVNAFGKAVRAVSGGNKIIAGALAPYGEEPGGARTRPLIFLRDLFCLKEKNGKLRRDKKCKGKVRFDILSHHPINLSGGPRRSAIDDDDASTPDFKYVKRTLRAAEKLNTVKGRHPVWATEIWWETPPQPNAIGFKRHAKWTAESLYVLWKQGAKVVINYVVRDSPPGNLDQTLESGLVKSNGKKKPAFAAFRFPFVVDRKRNGELLAWGKAPEAGRAKIQRKAGKGWRTVASTKAGTNRVFTTKFNGPRTRYRAKIGSEKSMPWRAPKR